MVMDIIIGLLLSLTIASLAYLKKSLTKDGLMMATLLGTVIYTFGTVITWVALIMFFISSSFITKLHEKKDRVDSTGRNYKQVLANSFITALFSLLFYVTKIEVYLIGAMISVEASNSDTWASEIGILSKGKTYSILNFKVVEKGISGAISKLGTFASLMGSMFIGLVFMITYYLYFGYQDMMFLYVFVVSLGGFVGCLVDSYLGALVQAKYKGLSSGKIVEVPHLEGESVILISGIGFITNDYVNFLSGLASTAVSMLILII